MTAAAPGLPADYVAVKLYFSDSFPDDDASRALVARVLASSRCGRTWSC